MKIYTIKLGPSAPQQGGGCADADADIPWENYNLKE
jgi:hypothetical protein